MLPAVWRLLDPRQRRRLVALQLLSVLMATATVGGIAAILPFFTVLTDPNVVGHSAVLHLLYVHMHFGSERAFVVALGLGFAAVVALANAVNLIGSLMMNRFAFQVGVSFGSALFAEYLHRPYAFHSVTHSSILSSKVLHETGRVTSGILQSGLLLVTNLVTIVFIVAAIVYLNPWVAICAVAGLGASYAAIYAAARGKLLRNGLAESHDFAARTKLVGESFGAIKEIILLRAQSFFVDKFVHRSKSISKTGASTHAISQSPRHVLECLTACSLVVTALYLSGRGSAAAVDRPAFVRRAGRIPPIADIAAGVCRACQNSSGSIRVREHRSRLALGSNGPCRSPPLGDRSRVARQALPGNQLARGFISTCSRSLLGNLQPDAAHTRRCRDRAHRCQWRR